MARSKTWAMDMIQRVLPTREELERVRLLRPVAHLLLQPALWRFTRRSVPRAIGIGLFAGILVMIPFVQPVAAALLAIPLRGNVPLTAATTFLSNPVTTPLLILAALWVASALFGFDADPGAVLRMIHEHAGFAEWKAWLFSDAAPAFLSGLLVIATVSAAVGYVLAGFAWRWWIGHKWRSRGRNRALRHA